MKKRLFTLALALCLLAVMLPAAVMAAEAETTGTCAEGCTYESVTVDATCTEPGCVRYTCAVCGDSYDEVTEDAKGHQYANGKCKICGTKKEGPAAPVVVLEPSTSNRYYLKWESVEGANQYLVYRSADGSKYSLWGWTNSYRTSYSLSESDAGTLYYYKVVAEDQYGAKSKASNVITFLYRLAKPQVKLSSVAATGNIKISWNKVPGAVKYMVYRSLSGEAGTWSRISTTTKTTVTNAKKMTPGTEYFYKVIAIAKDTQANSEYSETRSAVCKLAQPVVKTAYDEEKNGIQISWEPIEGAVRYKVYRSVSGKTGTWSRISTTTKTTVTNVKNISKNQKYYYKVIALAENTAANSAYSEAAVYMVKLAKPVVKLTNIESSGKIKVSWSAVEDAVSYQVYRAVGKNSDYSLLITTKNTSINNTSTTAGEVYYYKVVAVAEDPAANSDFSAVKYRTCDLPRPTVTAGVNTKGQPRLTWKAVDGAVSYKVYRADTKDGSYKLMKTATSTSYVNTSISTYETYYYKVVAVHSNSAANSAKSVAKGISSTSVNITPSKLSKDFANRLNEYRDYLGIDELDWNKGGELACRTRAAEYRIHLANERPDGRSVEKMLEAGGVLIELGFRADATAGEVVDALMYYEDNAPYAEILLYEGLENIVVARNNGYWCIMVG